MVAEAVDQRLPSHSHYKREHKDKKTCYAVKICVEKNSRCKSKPTCAPPQFPADALPSCNTSGQTRKPVRKARRESLCQTDDYDYQVHVCPNEQTKCKQLSQVCQTEQLIVETQSIKSKQVTDSHCQTTTVTKEVKQCGQQTSLCPGTCNQACQTERELKLERHCAAVTSIPPQRKLVTGPYCNTQKKQRHHYYPNSDCNRGSRGQEAPYVFPFRGTTPSGNWKVHPSMVSYQHKEFSVLVANPSSIRTRVTRVTNSDEKQDMLSCSKYQSPPPSPPPPYPPPRRAAPRDHGPASYSTRSRRVPLKSSQGMLSCSPNPQTTSFTLTNNNRFPPGSDLGSPRSYKTADCAHRHQRLPEPIKSNSRCNKPPEMTRSTKHPYGHTDGWTYVNSRYGNETQSGGSPRDEFHSIGTASTRGSPKWREWVDHHHDGDDVQLPPIEPRNRNNNNPFLQDFEYSQVSGRYTQRTNDTHFDYTSHSERSHIKSRLFRGKEYERRDSDNNDDERPPPYVPPFPKEERKARSGCERIEHSTETETMGDETASYDIDSSGCGGGSGGTEKSPDLVGKLHYLVKGSVGKDAKVVVGDAEFPVHSVVLEIRSKLFNSRDDGVQHVKIPTFIPRTNRFQEDGRCKKVCHRKVARKRQCQRRRDVSPERFFSPIDEEERNRRLAEVTEEQEEEEEEEEELVEEEPEPEPIIPQDDEEEEEENNQENDDQPELEPSEASVEAKETIFDMVEPDSSTQVILPPVPSTATEMTMTMFPEDETEDQSEYSILPNLDTQQGAILVFGGINPKVPVGPENSGRDVFMYILDINKWRRVGLLPFSRANFGLVRVDNFVYLIGGTDPERKSETGKKFPVQSNLRVDLRSGEWESLPELDKPRSHFGCVALDQDIYVMGGNIGGRASSSCQVFNIETLSWRSISSLSHSASHIGISVFGRKIVVAGGTTKHAKRPVLDSVTCYDPALDRWTSLKRLPTPRAFCSVAVVGDRLFVIGGAGMKNVNKRKNSSLQDILWYNEANQVWEEVEKLATPRHGHTSVVLGDEIIIVGGVSSQLMGALSSVEIFSVESEEVRMAKHLKKHLSGMAGVAL